MKVGSRVAVSQTFYAHAPESVLLADALPEGTPLGTVTAVANTEKTWFEVELDGKGGTHTFTIDELVQVKEARK